jgi:hypothetical protein
MPGAFRLLEQTGEELPYSWNANSLKRYYLESSRVRKIYFRVFSFIPRVYILEKQNLNHESISDFGSKNIYFLFQDFITIRGTILFSLQRGL